MDSTTNSLKETIAMVRLLEREHPIYYSYNHPDDYQEERAKALAFETFEDRKLAYERCVLREAQHNSDSFWSEVGIIDNKDLPKLLQHHFKLFTALDGSSEAFISHTRNGIQKNKLHLEKEKTIEIWLREKEKEIKKRKK